MVVCAYADAKGTLEVVCAYAEEKLSPKITSPTMAKTE